MDAADDAVLGIFAGARLDDPGLFGSSVASVRPIE